MQLIAPVSGDCLDNVCLLRRSAFNLDGKWSNIHRVFFCSKNGINPVHTLKGENITELWSVLGRSTLGNVVSHVEMLE